MVAAGLHAQALTVFVSSLYINGPAPGELPVPTEVENNVASPPMAQPSWLTTLVLVIRCNSPVMIVFDVPSTIDWKPVLWLGWNMPAALLRCRCRRYCP